MSSKAVLKSSVLGYIYRGLRIAGFLLIITGIGQLTAAFYRLGADGQADAIVASLDSVCIVKSEVGFLDALNQEIDCKEADKELAKYPNIPVSVGEVKYGRLEFKTENGQPVKVRERLDTLNAPWAEHGSIVSIAYDVLDPTQIRPAVSLAGLLEALSLLTAGAALLFAVWTVRWIAGHRRGIEVDVAKLQQAHDQMVRQSLRRGVTPADGARNPSNGQSPRRRA